MRVPRVFLDNNLETGTTLTLARATSHYLATVLRLQPGTGVRVFNGRDGEFSAELSTVSRQSVSLVVTDRLFPAGKPGIAIHLALGLSRGERMDFAVQKATELGVDRITPLYSEFGEVRIKQAARLDNKLRHWQRIAISACEQSGRIRIPQIDPPQPFADWIDEARDGLRLLLDPAGESALGTQESLSPITLAIGPEGGFSAQELARASAKGYAIVHIGPRILRTETAPVAALAILQNRYGDLTDRPIE